MRVAALTCSDSCPFGDVILLATMPYGGIGFFLGWAFSMGIMVNAGLVETWLVILYVLIGIVTISLKIWRNNRNNSGYYTKLKKATVIM